jgi:hypothetical protein
MFEGRLSPSHAQLKGYQAQFLDYIQHGMMVQNSKETFVGPCNINLQKKITASKHPAMARSYKKIIREANLLMPPFVQLIGVTTSQVSPFIKVFNTLTELKEAYMMYCPKTFIYDDAVGEEDEEEVELEVDDSGEQTKAAYVVAKIKEFADKTAADVDDDDADTDKSNMENEDDDDGGIDAILPFDAEATGATSRNDKLDSALDTSRKLWQAVADLVECKDMHDFFELSLCANA